MTEHNEPNTQKHNEPTTQSKKRAAPIDPTAEENFPDNPTRRAADREMNEPSNLRPSSRPTPRSDVPARELEEEE